ncbi:MAG: hypothetical protein WBA93_14990 [Microcoleaceae cyanobacterium]
MKFLNQLLHKNNSLKTVIGGPILVFLSTMTLPSLAQLPRFDSPLPEASSKKTPSSPIISPSTSVPNTSPQPPIVNDSTTPSSVIPPSTFVPSSPLEQPIVTDSTAPLPEERQSSIGIIKPVNGFVNIKLTNKTAATISYEVIGDTSQRQLSGKSEVILRTLKVPVNITFHRQQGGFLLIQPQFIAEQGILELTMTETNDFNLDKSSLLIENTGSVFLN